MNSIRSPCLQIGALKSLTIDIGAEVKEHNRLLKETDDIFDSVQGGLSNAMSKVSNVQWENEMRGLM